MSGLFLETRTSNLKSGALTVSELLAFNIQKFRGSRDPGHAPFSKKILRGHVRTVPGNMRVEFEVVALTILNWSLKAKNLVGHVTLATRLFEKKFYGVSLGTRLTNLNSVALTVLELLAFNAQKFSGSRDSGHVPFRKKF